MLVKKIQFFKLKKNTIFWFSTISSANNIFLSAPLERT